MGYPVMLKAFMECGGKGMHLVDDEGEIADAYNRARSESMSSFSDDTVYLEKFIKRPHHIEFQILGDNHGNIIHLFNHEYSVQHRKQKIVEERPSPFLTDLKYSLTINTIKNNIEKESKYLQKSKISSLPYTKKT